MLIDNSTQCWGVGTSGQLGNDEGLSSNTPVPVSFWDSLPNSLPDDLIPPPAPPPPAAPISSRIAAGTGTSHSCAVQEDRTVQCWGAGSSGQLGNGRNVNSNIPVRVSRITTAAQVSTGASYSCALLADGTVQCWGAGDSGQLGNGGTDDSNLPVVVSVLTDPADSSSDLTPLTDVTLISTGASYSCALLADGTVQCWGAGDSGQLGNSGDTNSNTPVTVSNIATATRVSAGASHACALLADGTVQCWGLNGEGQLGNSGDTNSNTPVTVSVLTDPADSNSDLTALTGVTAISAGASHTCASLAARTVQCWGTGDSGQLGNGADDNSPTPVSVSQIAGLAAQISAGNSHSCAVLLDETVQCWGLNDNGQLGNDDNTNSNTPVVVSSISAVAEVSAGSSHTCALLLDETVQCWGLNGEGQLGNSGNTNSNTPVVVSPTAHPINNRISTGASHSCAVLANGTIRCWGSGSNGRLGNNAADDSGTPVTVSNIDTAVQVSAGASHTCAVLTSGAVQCWGAGGAGRLGNGGTNQSTTPVQVSGITSAVQVSAGTAHSCAVLENGQVWCWGNNGSGRLGNGVPGLPTSTTPVQVSGLAPTAIQVSGGRAHTCALLEAGTVWCWGQADQGRLGDGRAINVSGSEATQRTPVQVSNISTATAISVNDRHACALLENGRIRCWGRNNESQLGNGGSTTQTMPRPVSGITTAAQISAGDSHSCAVLLDGTSRCWGAGGSGRLGNNAADNSNTPVLVSNIDTAAQISAGGQHTCAVIASELVQCWGLNSVGQLGDGGNTASNIPVSVSGLS